MHRLIILVILLITALTGAAQGFFPKREKSFPSGNDTIQIDTLSIVPGTLKVKLIPDDVFLQDSIDYAVDYASAKLYTKKSFTYTSLEITYEVFPFLLTQERSHKNQGAMTSTPDNRVNPFTYNPKAKTEDPFAMGGLNKSGSLSRGISFGNTRDVSVNSNLNLQISGRLTDNVDLMMVATDDNLPIQADGTTQQLQEFDRVYIQISSPTTKLIAGDFFTTKPNSYFMNFNKRGQGLSVTTTIPLDPKVPFAPMDSPKNSLHVSASAAISKGKFARNVITGVEGNQGPYRLRGAENELFIIVLSGTEKVYIDGKLMVRGQENDYIIDYNTSEITFTAKQLITKDKRIVVEFQYSDRNYSRSLVHSGITWEKTSPVLGIDKGKAMPKQATRLTLNAYSEQDHKNQPVQQTLTDDDILVLSQIGDTLNRAIIPGTDSVGFSDTEVRYRKTDSLVNSVLYPDVFVYSTDSELAHWRAAFSYVGPNNGNYKQVSSAANGKVFEWIAPVNGVPQGDYEPVILIVTPKKRQMVTFGGQRTTKNSDVSAELALSNNDLNTFSQANSEDDQGYGGSFGYKKKFAINDSIELSANVKYEYISRNFTFIERYRPVEFERDWNLGWNSTRKPTADQHMVISNFRYGSTKNKFITGYDFSAFNEGAQYTGIKNGILLGVNHKRIRATMNASYLTSTGAYGKTDFSRQRANITIPVTKKISIGGWEEIEFSRVHKPNSDTLQAQSFGYIEWESFALIGDSVKTFVRGFYKQRSDWLPMGTLLDLATFGENIGATVGFNQLKNQRLNITASYRKLDIRNYLITQLQPDNTVVGRVEYSVKLLKGSIDLNTFYEAGSGLEVKKEFFYLEVPAGQGAFAWTDYNNNGVKELNEFEVALFSDQALYIRVYTPTNQYVKVYTNQFSQSVRLKTPQAWQSKKGLRKFLTRFSDQAVYRVDRKTQSNLFEHAYVPQIDDAGDTSLVTLNATVRNTIFFNQLSSKFGLDYTWQTVKGKNLLTNGLESRGNEYNQVRMRWNITRAFAFSTEYKRGVKSNSSAFFSTRNYFINYFDAEPKLSYQPGTTFRVSLLYRYSEKKNSADLGGETTNLQKLGVEFRATKASKGSLDAEFNYFRIAYDGTVNSTIGYEMLEGLKPGENFTWKAAWQQNLGGGLQLTLGYEGRKTPDNKPIHTGTAQVRAMF